MSRKRQPGWRAALAHTPNRGRPMVAPPVTLGAHNQHPGASCRKFLRPPAAGLAESVGRTQRKFGISCRKFLRPPAAGLAESVGRTQRKFGISCRKVFAGVKRGLFSKSPLLCVPCHCRMIVPEAPESASGAFSSDAITARRSLPLSAKAIAASTFGSILPGAKCPSAI